ncbi:MAG: hypothetical protein SGJ23_11920 [Alphaproteobacteria bacterium]|nr:hypothetical protein [Alphaproteobacteria bacterium]
MEALPYILQIAFFGAAGTSFVLAHLKNLAAQRQSGEAGNPAKRWRFWRHQHLRPPENQTAAQLRRASLMQSIWGFGFLVAGFVTPFASRLFQTGP